MAELREWMKVLAIFGSGWACAIGGSWLSAIYNADDKPPEAFGLAP